MSIVTAALELRAGDQERLEAVLRRPASDDGDVLRAGIILLCAEGIPPREIQRQLHTSLDSVARWRSRYEAMGMAGLEDAPRIGPAQYRNHAGPARNSAGGAG